MDVAEVAMAAEKWGEVMEAAMASESREQVMEAVMVAEKRAVVMMVAAAAVEVLAAPWVARVAAWAALWVMALVAAKAADCMWAPHPRS